MVGSRAGRWALAFVLGSAAAIVPTAVAAGVSTAAAAVSDPCGPGSNPIVCENSKAGTDPSVWDISGAGDADIQGFATQMSVNPGQPVGFKIDTDASAYDITIYRTGWYGGLGARVVLSKPTSFMNVSSGPVASLSNYFKIDRTMVVVVHHELDIPFAQVRLKRGGGEGGHNGVRDISKALGTNDYIRVRVGIGSPPGRMDPADFVLRDFSARERTELPWLCEAAADAVELVMTAGLAAAQQRFHSPA